MVIGALTLVRPEANRFTEEDLKTIGQISTIGQGNTGKSPEPPLEELKEDLVEDQPIA